MQLDIGVCITDEVIFDVILQGGSIRGSINLPAQSVYPTIPTLYSLFKAARLHNIIWYCCKLAFTNYYLDISA